MEARKDRRQTNREQRMGNETRTEDRPIENKGWGMRQGQKTDQ